MKKREGNMTKGQVIGKFFKKLFVKKKKKTEKKKKEKRKAICNIIHLT